MDPFIEMVKNLIAKLIKSTKSIMKKKKVVVILKLLNQLISLVVIIFLFNLRASEGGDESGDILDGLLELFM